VGCTICACRSDAIAKTRRTHGTFGRRECRAIARLVSARSLAPSTIEGCVSHARLVAHHGGMRSRPEWRVHLAHVVARARSLLPNQYSSSWSISSSSLPGTATNSSVRSSTAVPGMRGLPGLALRPFVPKPSSGGTVSW